jgi:hypothetical protein
MNENGFKGEIKMKKIISCLLIGMCGLMFSPAVFADSSGNEDLKAEIAALKARLTQLEAKLAMPPAVSTAPSTVPASNVPTLQLPNLTQGVALSGFVDATYNYNFNSPNSRTNAARIFDGQANQFNLNATMLRLQKNPTEDSRVGFTTDFYAGHDAELTHSAGLGTDEPFDLIQGYVEMLLPTKNVIPGANDIDLKAGKFVTQLGAEVIYGKDNWNISRSLEFNYAIPFTNTGVYASYPFVVAGQNMHIAGGVANGWDNVTDNNNGKTALWQFGLDGIAMPGDSNLTITLGGDVGPERANASSIRSVTDLCVCYKTPWKPLTLMYDFDYGNESDLVSQNASGINGDAAEWIGHAGYARIDINDQWSISGRGEYLRDDDGVRVISGTPASYWEWTGTLEYRPWKNLITRLEYRYDGADRNAFAEKSLPTPVFKDNQSTIAAEVIYIF